MSSAAPRPSLVENPWFWLMLFGATGMVAIMVIGPKYAVRQARLERMALSRDRAAVARQAGVPPSEVRQEPADDAPVGLHPAEPYVDADFHEPPKLKWLLGLTTILMLVGTAGLIVSRRRKNLITS